MTEQELKEYEEYVKANYRTPFQYTLPINFRMTNAEDTSDHVAPQGKPWIEYWRAMTHQYSNSLRCSCKDCEKFITNDTDDTLLRFLAFATGSSTESMKANGAHIKVNPQYKDVLFIAPLCTECNNKRGEDIVFKEGTIIVEEITELNQ